MAELTFCLAMHDSVCRSPGGKKWCCGGCWARMTPDQQGSFNLFMTLDQETLESNRHLALQPPIIFRVSKERGFKLADIMDGMWTSDEVKEVERKAYQDGFNAGMREMMSAGKGFRAVPYWVPAVGQVKDPPVLQVPGALRELREEKGKGQVKGPPMQQVPGALRELLEEKGKGK